MAIEFTLNGKRQSVDVVPQMPLLWVLRDTLGLTARSSAAAWRCVARVPSISMDNRHAHALCRFRWLPENPSPLIEGLSADSSHPIQKPRIEVDVPQCGYCQSGQMSARPSGENRTTDSDIDEAMRGTSAAAVPTRKSGSHPSRRTVRERRSSMNRRHSLKSTAVATGGLVLGFYLPDKLEGAAEPNTRLKTECLGAHFSG
jgi:aerobic-type carbon monoxide dehydrogenase small subunit (CoxS/CutS family)